MTINLTESPGRPAKLPYDPDEFRPHYLVRIVAMFFLGNVAFAENAYILHHLYKLYKQPSYKLTRLQALVLVLTLTNFLIVVTQIPQDILWHITG